MNKKLSMLIITCLLATPLSAFAQMPNFALKLENIERKTNIFQKPIRNILQEEKQKLIETKDKIENKIQRERLELIKKNENLENKLLEERQELQEKQQRLENKIIEKKQDLKDTIKQPLAPSQKRNLLKEFIKSEDQKFHIQRPQQIKKILKPNLKLPQEFQSKKYHLQIKSSDNPISGSLSTQDRGVRILNLRNLGAEDQISGRIGETIDFKTQEAKDITILFEIPSSQSEFTLILNNQTYQLSTDGVKKEELKNSELDSVTIKHLTNKKILKESKDYIFENKGNAVENRLKAARNKLQNKKECLELHSQLKSMEFDGFENRAENLFKVLELNPNETICRAAKNNFPKIKKEINELRFQNKKIMFRDTAEGWFKSHIERISQRLVRGKKLFEGYKDASGKATGEFGPLNEVRLGELLKVALIAAGHDANPTISNDSLTQEHWANGFAQTATDLNMSIALDLSDLNRSVTRGQVLQTFAESLMLINPLDPEANKDVCDYQIMAETFADFDANHPHSLVACIFVQDGIIKGSQGNLMLNGATNRAEIAKILNNVMDKYVDAQEILEEITEDDSNSDQDSNDNNTAEENPDLDNSDPTIEADDNSNQEVQQEQQDSSSSQEQGDDQNQTDPQPAQDQ